MNEALIIEDAISKTVTDMVAIDRNMPISYEQIALKAILNYIKLKGESNG